MPKPFTYVVDILREIKTDGTRCTPGGPVSEPGGGGMPCTTAFWSVQPTPFDPSLPEGNRDKSLVTEPRCHMQQSGNDLPDASLSVPSVLGSAGVNIKLAYGAKLQNLHTTTLLHY